MRRITALSSGKGRSKQTKLYLDGEPALAPGKVGQEEPASQSQASESECRRKCFNAAARFSGYRPRSEYEVRQRLRRGGFDSADIEAALIKLKEKGMIDDLAFARSWLNDRSSFKPRSQRLIKLELKQKGIATDIIEQVTGAMSDFESACQAAMAKARTLSHSDYDSFRRRLGEFLKRRGFDYRDINRAVEHTWQELGNTEHRHQDVAPLSVRDKQKEL